MIITNGKLDLLLDLYFSGFDKKKGTLLFISEKLKNSYGNTRVFLTKLKEEKVIFPVDITEINGKLHDVYSIDKEALADILKENAIFKKIYKVIYELSPDIVLIGKKELVEIYSKEEMENV